MIQTVEETELRKQARKEAGDDLEKSFDHLLVDIHEELLNRDRESYGNNLHAQKRTMSLMAKAAQAAESSSNRMIALTESIESAHSEVRNLTKRIYWLTWALVGLTAVIILVGLYPLFVHH